MVREGDGLRALEMRIARHYRLLVRLRDVAEGAYDVLYERGGLLALALEVEPRVERHLVVAAAGGVQLLARVAYPRGELRLHEGVYVLGGGVNLQRAGFQVGEDAAEALYYLRALGGRDYPALGEHARVGYAARDILLVHSRIHADAGVELVGEFVQRARAASRPELFHIFLSPKWQTGRELPPRRMAAYFLFLASTLAWTFIGRP